MTGPVDTTATVSGDAFRQCLELLSAAGDVDAIIALVLPTAATGDLTATITQAQVSVPIAAVVLGQPESVRLLGDADGKRIPAYDCPEAAAGAMARAAAYGTWRAARPGPVPAFPDVSAAQARALVHGFLSHAPGGGWLPPREATALLARYGIAPVPLTADHAARLTPLTTTDADTLISSVRAAPLLRGYRGTPAADLGALRNLLLRVSRLAEDLPEVTELGLNPVIARPDGAHIVDARVKVMPCKPQDPFLRQLR